MTLDEATEARRLERIRHLRLIDSAPEAAVDRLVQLASRVLDMPIALVSVVDDRQQWFKARVGLGMERTPRAHSFCAHALADPDRVLQVPDARADPRFDGNPMVTGEPHIRFYAGAPLVTADGLALGTLCVIDREPRRLDPTGEALLRELARQAARVLERPLAPPAEPGPSTYIDRSMSPTRMRLLETMLNVGTEPKAFVAPDYTYRLVNQPLLDWWRVEAQDVLGRPVPHLVGQAAFDQVLRPALDRALAGERVVYERAAELPVIGRRRLRVTCSPAHDDDGRVFGVKMIALDVEELRAQEDRTRALVDSLRHRNAEQQRFVHVLSHDMKEPLNTIRNFIELLAEPGHDEAARRRFQGFVMRGVDRMAHLIDDLRDYLSADARVVPFEPVALDPLLDRVLEALDAQIRARGATIERTPLGGVVGAPAQIELMLQNLVSNAIKFVAPGVAPRLVASARAVGERRQVRLQDNGIGIPPEYAEAVFEPFRRLNNRRDFEGSGLGLSLVHRICEQHDGRVWVEPAGGGGSVFVVELPDA